MFRTFARGRRWAFALTLLALVAAVLVAACDDDDDDDDAGASPTATASTATATTTATATPTEEAAPAALELSVGTDGALGSYLVGPDGRTLYVFTVDRPGVSNCGGQCIDNWPPLLIGDGQEPTAFEGLDGELGVIEREDGLGRQVTYAGAPLYYWLADQLPGDTTGHGVGDVWSVATPSGATSLSSQQGYDY